MRLFMCDRGFLFSFLSLSSYQGKRVSSLVISCLYSFSAPFFGVREEIARVRKIYGKGNKLGQECKKGKRLFLLPATFFLASPASSLSGPLNAVVVQRGIIFGFPIYTMERVRSAVRILLYEGEEASVNGLVNATYTHVQPLLHACTCARVRATHPCRH